MLNVQDAIMDQNKTLNNDVKLKQVKIDDDIYFMITNNDRMRPFFMSIVSDSDHWMFISSNGGLSAGRKNAEKALFPYYTDDKITESAEITGSKSIFRVNKNNKTYVWEPFSERQIGLYKCKRNLYKGIYGNKILFEEINYDLGITFRYEWCSSNEFGFIRKSTIINNANSSVDITLLDGIQNIMPSGVNTDLQVSSSNLVDAYKRNELDIETGLGIYTLSAIIVDRAEPSEALKANIIWSLGLDKPSYLISSLQLNSFRRGESLKEEVDIKAERGAYFISEDCTIAPNEKKEWLLVADVNQSVSSLASISKKIKENIDLKFEINKDINLGTKRLINLVSSTDGFQLTADKRGNARHYSNSLFNIMRGGIFDNGYHIEKKDFDNYLLKANRKVYHNSKDLIAKLPDVFLFQELRDLAYKSEDKNFRRLALEYLPLKFSRRHGDPSRPWNKFSINTRSEIDGSKILDYEGNWRDIFQNWEALAYSFPEFIEGMISRFLNASTFDGYNPYRVTKDGFDWEVIEEHDPWSYIGYWGDHQIIYLLKFLEIFQSFYPERLTDFFKNDLFVYANIPYKIKPYLQILKNPKDTIDFDEELDEKIRKKRSEFGSDGAILRDENYFIHKVNFIEKILASVLAKMSNFIPEGGIWLNTQRPEWNDANNALVGNGVSMVTLYYLRRFLKYFERLFEVQSNQENHPVSVELYDFYESIKNALKSNEHLLSGKISDKERKLILDELGTAGSTYRWNIYNKSFCGDKKDLQFSDLLEFTKLSIKFLEHTIEANKRHDNMYHAYNLMTVKNGNEISISYLSEMLEGQVAVLSSGYLNAKDSLNLLDGLKGSKLFREDQYSYILYPNKELPKFTQKNNIPSTSVHSSKLLSQLLNENNEMIVEQDCFGNYHFNSDFNNADSLKCALELVSDFGYSDLVEKEYDLVLSIFEEVFNHKAFTGRSGTFFGYEGLGSIYWHMVSKLVLAVQETCLRAINNDESEVVVGRLLEHYYEINEGIGVHKSPKLYGAFPTDPYSHTPAGKGAQQPGMTGQVKEDILTRFGELGVFVNEGIIYFKPFLLRSEEFLKEEKPFTFTNVSGDYIELLLSTNQLAYTYCQVPIIYNISNKNKVVVSFKNNTSKEFSSLCLDKEVSTKIFKRTDEVEKVEVFLDRMLI